MIKRLNECSTLQFYFRKKIKGSLHFSYQGNCIYISDVNILPEEQNKGFGSKMMKETISFVKKYYKHCKELKLDVLSNNERAIIVYLKNGFKISKSSHNCYHHLEMIRDL